MTAAQPERSYRAQDAKSEAAYLESLASKNDSKGLQNEMAAISRNGNSAYFAALQQSLNTYSSNDSLVPKLTLTDGGSTPAGNEVLSLSVHQPNAKTDELIKTDGTITTDTSVTDTSVTVGAGIGDRLPSGTGNPASGGEQQKWADRANSDSNSSQGHWDPSTNTYTSSNGYSY